MNLLGGKLTTIVNRMSLVSVCYEFVTSVFLTCKDTNSLWEGISRLHRLSRDCLCNPKQYLSSQSRLFGRDRPLFDRDGNPT